jgi:flagellar biogenesis protein FliO
MGAPVLGRILRRALPPVVVAGFLAGALGAAAAATVGSAKEAHVASPRASSKTVAAPGVVRLEPRSGAPGETPASVPSAGESLTSVGLRLLVGSLLLAGLLYGAARLLKRMPLARLLPTADGPIKVIGRAHLGPKGSLCLVEVGPSTLLIGVTANAIQALHVWPEGADSAAAPAAARPAIPGQLKNLESRLTGRNA